MAKKRKAMKNSASTTRKRAKSRRNRSRPIRSALAIATDTSNSVSQRVAAMAQTPLAACEDDESLQSLLNVLRDRREPVDVRLAALQSLQAASFSVVAFESCRGDYIATLRELVEDPDPELRQRVLGMLAREKDGFAQQRLLEGLRNPERALVPPEKALQLLSYDVHAEAYPVAREIVNNPPNPIAKREALRLLAADASAAPMFEKILLDKAESPEIRQISAAALQAIKPKTLQTHARAILLDASERDEIQAVSLTAISEFGDDAAVARDEALLQRVDRLSGEASAKVKQSARQFLNKYRR